MYESKTRAILKAVSWRIFASIITVMIVALFTGDIRISTTIGLIDMVAKILLYYMHERIWNNIHIGKHSLKHT